MNLKIGLFFLALFGASQAILAQEEQPPEESQDEPPAYSIFHYGYQQALRYNDFSTATNKLYDVIAMYPGNDSLRMSLAMLYYDRQMYASSLLVALDVSRMVPDHEEAIELSAICYETLGLKEKSLERFEKAYLLNNDIKYLYRMAFLQYELESYQQCLTNIDIILEDKRANTEKAVYNVGENQQKEFTFQVAVLNLRGLVYKELGNFDEARASWNQALEIAPDFELAQENLESLEEE